MIEGAEGVQNINEILTIPGIDIIFVGPYDLSQSLGLLINQPSKGMSGTYT